jgi:hypothetical protein
MCQIGTCTDEAEFLVKEGRERVRAVCREHLKMLGVSEADIPPKDTK